MAYCSNVNSWKENGGFAVPAVILGEYPGYQNSELNKLPDTEIHHEGEPKHWADSPLPGRPLDASRGRMDGLFPGSYGMDCSL